MKRSSYIMLFLAAAFLIINCERSDEHTNADQAFTAQAAIDTDDSVNIVTAGMSESLDNWYHDWDDAIAAAAKEKKPMIVDFYTDWCKWCKVMDKETFADPAVKEIMSSGWISVKIDAENDKKKGTFKDKTFEYNKLAMAFGVRVYPSYLFIDKNGQPITIVSSFFEKDKFIPILDYFSKELYTKEVDLQEYIESKS